MTTSEVAGRRISAGIAATRRDLMILAVVMLLGLGVRMYGLTGYGIWFDEGYHIALVQLPTVGAMVDALISNPPSDPLYVMLLRAWVGLFGHDNAAVRMLSVLASTSTLPAIYLLGRQAASNTIGLLGALLFALSPYAVELGQEAALYSLAALTTTAALTAGWRWRTTGRGRAAYMVFAVLAIYSHYVVVVILILFAAFSLHPAAGPRKVSARTWIISNAAIGVLWLPWLAALAVHWWSSALTRTALRHPATAAELFDALVQYTSGSAALHVQNRWLETLGLAVGAALFTMGLGMLHPWSGRLRLVAVIAAIVFAGPAIVSTLTGLWLFVPHFMLFLLPALVLIPASGALAVVRVRWGIAQWIGPTLLAMWLAIQLGGLWLYNRYPPHGADGLRELATLLRDDPSHTPVLVTPPVLAVTLRQYYPGDIHGLPTDFDLRVVYSPVDQPRWNNESMAALDAQTTNLTRFWLVYRPELDEHGGFLRAVEAKYHEESHHTYEYAELYRFGK